MRLSRARRRRLSHSSRRGLTLLELMIAMSILAVALLGGVALILALQTHNQSFSDARVAYKACQDQMEYLLHRPYDQMWQEAGLNDKKFPVPELHPTALVGFVRLRDVFPATDPGKVTEIEVGVNTEAGFDPTVGEVRTVGLKPLTVSLFSRRTSVP